MFYHVRYAFAVEECNERERAEKILRRALDLNKETPFAYHAMCKPKLHPQTPPIGGKHDFKL